MKGHVYFYTHVANDYATAAVRLAGNPQLWLPAPAEEAGDLWLIDVCAEGALPSALATHATEVSVGPPERTATSLRRALTWRSARLPAVIPMLAADLELTPLEDDSCRLTLVGTYRPPLAVVGGIADRLHGHRVAEACARRFVLDVEAHLLGVTSQPA